MDTATPSLTPTPAPIPVTPAVPTVAAPAAPQAVKSGWKTSEFWLKLAAMALTALFGSGVIPSHGSIETVAVIAATMLGSLGYTVSRTMVKSAQVVAIFFIVFGMAACATSSAEVITVDAETITVASIGKGVEIYGKDVVTIPDQIRQKAEAACFKKLTHALRQQCADDTYNKAWAPYVKANKAIARWKELLAAGVAIGNGDFAKAEADVIVFLSAVGIRITGGSTSSIERTVPKTETFVNAGLEGGVL